MHIKLRDNVNDNGNCMLILCFQIDFEVNEVKHLDNYTLLNHFLTNEIINTNYYQQFLVC